MPTPHSGLSLILVKAPSSSAAEAAGATAAGAAAAPPFLSSFLPYCYYQVLKSLLSVLWSSSGKRRATHVSSTQATGVIFKAALIRSGVAPTATQAPHSLLLRDTVPVSVGKHSHIKTCAAAVPAKTTRKYMLWRGASKTLKSRGPIFLQLMKLKSCKNTKVLKM